MYVEGCIVSVQGTHVSVEGKQVLDTCICGILTSRR